MAGRSTLRTGPPDPQEWPRAFVQLPLREQLNKGPLRVAGLLRPLIVQLTARIPQRDAAAFSPAASSAATAAAWAAELSLAYWSISAIRLLGRISVQCSSM